MAIISKVPVGIAIGCILAAPVFGKACPAGKPSTNTVSGGFDYTYPYPIRYLPIETQGQTLCQAYMDILPRSAAKGNADSDKANRHNDDADQDNGYDDDDDDGDEEGPGRSDLIESRTDGGMKKAKGRKNKNKTVMMLHGKNFCSVTWEETAEFMLDQGYRVILPDQIGFCKSSKPENYDWTLQQLAVNTMLLLEELEIDSVILMGHSLGGMLAARFALMFPGMVEKLIMVDPVGLEDWKAKGVPYLPLEDIYQVESSSSYESIRAYEQAVYYLGEWTPAYDVWVRMLLKLYNGPLGDLYARIQSEIVNMVFTQPVIYEFPLLGATPSPANNGIALNVETLLVVGANDTTAIGAQWSPPEIAQRLGDYPALARNAVNLIGESTATAIIYPNVGHVPQISDPEMFHADLIDWLES